MLKQEIRDLKECQVKFLTFSVTVTGALLSLAVSLAPTVPETYLFPLTVLIPFWWIFFDKATTITRIVGYYRILENAILMQGSVNFIGWENALAKFREMERKGELKFSIEESLLDRFIEFALLKTNHRYWVLTYYTFFGLSILCLILSVIKGANIALVVIVTVITIISAVKNARLVSNLIWGRNSYKANEHFWKQVLR